MQPTLADIEMLVTFFVSISIVLTVLGLFAVLWRDAWLMLFAVVVRSAHRVGLFRASEQKNGRTPQSGKRDGSFLAFSALLQALCKVIPGDPNRHPHTYVIPVTLVTIPTILLVLVVFWAMPFYIFGYVSQGIEHSWSTVVAFFSIFVYIGVVGVTMKLLARTPAAVKRVGQKAETGTELR